MLILAGISVLLVVPVQSTPCPRVIALLPNFTEIVIALGAGECLVGYSNLADTQGLPARAVNVGGALDPDTERIVALKPDLIFLQDTQRELQKRLSSLGLRAIALPSFTCADVYHSIKTIAGLLDRQPEGKKLIKKIKGELSDVSRRVSTQPPVSAMLVIGHADGALREIYLAGRGTFLDELLVYAGGTNVMTENNIPYPKIGTEDVMLLNPEVIFVLDPNKDDSPAALIRERRLWAQLPYLQAVKKKRIYLLPQEHLLIPGPRMAQIAVAFASRLHPEATAQP